MALILVFFFFSNAKVPRLFTKGGPNFSSRLHVDIIMAHLSVSGSGPHSHWIPYHTSHLWPLNPNLLKKAGPTGGQRPSPSILVSSVIHEYQALKHVETYVVQLRSTSGYRVQF